MKNHIQSLFILFLLLVGGSVFAQTTEFTGIVTSVNGSPLSGVSVSEEGTSNTALTGMDGSFKLLSTSTKATLTFSAVGIKTKRLTATGGKFIDVVVQEGIDLEDVVVVGSRNVSRTSVGTPVPVDVIDLKGLTKSSPQVNINQIMNYVAPSFTSNVQNIADGTDHIDPASLRGLGPDQVLVLVNGKRRHTSSLVNVNGTFGRGNVGTDLNAIPAASIERIEVLRDGAAAQYGSDAIAGVINLVLKKDVNHLVFNATTSSNLSENANGQTGGFDGLSTNISANYGLTLGKKGGVINFTGDFDVRNAYNRMKQYEGQIFNAYNAIEYKASKAGYDISKFITATDFTDLKNYAQQVSYFSSTLKNDINSATSKATLQTLLKTDVTNDELVARGQTRSDYNNRVGQSALRGGRFFANLILPLDEQGTEFYAFSGVSSRQGNSAGFYRFPFQARTYTPVYVNGFLPEINSTINDLSIAAGIRGKIKEWNVDFSNTYGRNSFMYTIGNTANVSLQNSTPTTFDAGGHSFSQNTTNLDVSRFFGEVLEGLNVALGSEYRVENFEIVAGEPYSYGQYTQNGDLITSSSQSPATDFFGAARPGGAQVYSGFSPKNELSRNRNSIAAYGDLELDITDAVLISGATRFENYSDFGSTINFKLATRIKLNDRINLRASGNTGFRAPSLHQLYFNSTSTQFTSGVPQEVGTFTNDSRAATLLGIPKLKQETSRSVSLGFTAKLLPNKNLTLTADAYFVAIDNRVVLTGQFTGAAGSELAGILAQANATSAIFFVNAINTESKGIDVVLTHNAKITNRFNLKSEFSATLSQTQRVGDIQASDLLRRAGLVSTYFDAANTIFLEKAVPMTKANLSLTLSSTKFSIFLRNVYFGEVTESSNTVADQQLFSAKVVTDLSLGYKVSNAIGLTIGSNNLLDVYPDRLITASNRQNGQFDWSRRSQQFGIGGRSVFARLTIDLK